MIDLKELTQVVGDLDENIVRMRNVTLLSEERTHLFCDLFEGRIPKRVPIQNDFPLEFSIQYAGKDLIAVQWDTSFLEEVFDKMCQDFVSDTIPVFAHRFPSYYQILGAKNFVMGSNGFLQHPEVHGLGPEDYDELIASPYDCIMEEVLPRIYTELNARPVKQALALSKAYKAYYDEFGSAAMIYQKLVQKYGYTNLLLIAGYTLAPFDFLAGQVRGFTGIVSDIRRVPEKVEAALEAITPLLIKKGMPMFKTAHTSMFIPLHMAPFLRTKDFERFYWPSFKKLVEALTEAGTPCSLFVEQDWMRYLDYLYELPKNTRMRFEYGDPKLVKDKLGNKHIISGFYPISLLKTGTKQQCIDKVKELVDILAPGGNYMFEFDKVPITIDTVNLDNTRAVLEYVATKAIY